MVCFQGIHLFYSIIAVMFNVMFLLIALIVAMNFFESRITSKNKMAKSNSIGEVYFILNKITLQLVFIFLSNQWILVGVLFAGSAIMAYHNLLDDPFYNKFVATYHRILNMIYIWSTFTIFALKVIEPLNFEGAIIIWLIGLPFMVLIAFSVSQNDLQALIKSQMKFENDVELLQHTKMLLMLIERRKNDQESYLLLIGYIQKHQEVCQEADCPLKAIKQTEKGVIDMDDMIIRLINAIDRLYSNGVKKFKRSIQVRISYAFFLLERTTFRKKALEQLTVAEILEPSFEDQFLIYRYKKIIEDNLGDQTPGSESQEQEVDIVGLIAFESHLKACIHFIKQTTEEQKQYWQELLQEKPSLESLSIIGSLIDDNVRRSNENWQKLSKMSQNAPVIIKLYAKFLAYILNEQEQSLQLLD